jgi:formamidopyrimidine-DNA glycosylase
LPELPEVETVVRSIAPLVRGRTILRAEVRSHRVTRQPFGETAEALTGATIQDVGRLGKQIFVQLDRGTLYIHLGMTGKLLWNAEDDKFTRALLELENGTLFFHDVRQFGRFEFFREMPAILSNKGPDALTVDFETFYSRLRRHRGAIKAVLLNQVFVSGVGNIYADEILFAAHVHPRTQTARISRRRAKLLHEHTQEILQAAIQLGGSSISDYVDAAGKKGEFQLLHRVYGRTGEKCSECGTLVRRIVIGQRGTHYCPHCQRA